MNELQPAKPDGRNPLVTALLVVVGSILLLPGLCSVLASVVWIRGIVFEGYHPSPYDSAALLVLLGCFAVGAVGVVFIVIATRR